jgi:acyl dehydratase
LGAAATSRYLWLQRVAEGRPARGGWEWAEGTGERVAESDASLDELLKDMIGKPTGRSKVVVERGPVSLFAAAVGSTSPIYRDLDAAKAAGFDSIPAPPTWPFAMEFAGKFDEIQPADAATGSPLTAALGRLMANGGLILHGEQEFIYHRPIVVGDVLVSEGKVVDAYQKESKGRTMTFFVSETTWNDDKSGEPVVTAIFNLIHRA